ncbi:hypothetical protein F0562_010384 [Nyssa sinensis]|uniref:Uncharacterized protein n=1 Tax=Nyssa sinensis TaxID=561372 RepID=A0A5J4ZZD1_9ASTE|nr:hypothetical protein F0562_010384 [Nyssa sinensis]
MDQGLVCAAALIAILPRLHLEATDVIAPEFLDKKFWLQRFSKETIDCGPEDLSVEVGEPKVPDLQLRETKIVEPETTQGQSGTPVQLDSSDAAATENDQAECSCIGSGCCSMCQVFNNQENQIRQIEPRPGVYFLEVLKDDVRGGNTLGAKRVQPMGNPLTQGDEMRAVQGSLTTQKVTLQDLMCGSKGLSIQEKNREHPLGNSWIHGREEGLSIGMQKVESAVTAATFCPAMGRISSGAKEERPLDNSSNQGGGVVAVPALWIATKCPFLDLKGTSKRLPPLDATGGKMGAAY